MAMLLVEVGFEWGVSEGVIRSWLHSSDCSSMSRFSFCKHKSTGIKQKCCAFYILYIARLKGVGWKQCGFRFMHESVLPHIEIFGTILVNLWHFAQSPILIHKPYLIFSLGVD